MAISPFQKFKEKDIITLDELKTSGVSFMEKKFISLGGGVGSFCWVDALRIHGTKKEEIAVVSHFARPYQQFKYFCEGSALFETDRLRSDSGTRPDNFWGFPGYAVDEIIDHAKAKKFAQALKTVWQILSEPILQDYYTPTAGRIYKSLNREMKRIGWSEMLQIGHILFLRKLKDGRYAIFYVTKEREIRAVLSGIVHISLGHKVKNSSYDMIDGTQSKVMGGYSIKKEVFESLEKNGGRVVITGRGITAARVIQQLLKINNPNITVTSLFRNEAENLKDHRNLSQNIFNGWRLQSFNWPRSSFAGPLKEYYEKIDKYKRPQVSKAWSVPTTSPRKKWLKTIKNALKRGNYLVFYGEIDQLRNEENHLLIKLKNTEGKIYHSIKTDYLIDCVGFDDKISQNDFYKDLIATYKIPVSPVGASQTNEYFELEELSSPNGSVFVTGVAAAGNSYGPVDSFFGHQYTALKSLEKIIKTEAFNIHTLTTLESVKGWIKWTFNKSL